MKRVISFLLSIVMVISMLPVSAFATDVQPEDPTTSIEVTEPSTEATEPSTEATEPSTEATEPSTEVTEPSTEATQPSEEATEPSTEATEPVVKSEKKTAAQTYISDVSLPDSDDLLDAYLEKVFYSSDVSVYGRAAGDTLTGPAKNLYDWLKSQIQKVAAGEVSSTTFVANQHTLEQWDVPLNYNSSDINVAAAELLENLEMSKVLDALLHDCPYELYWFDKTEGIMQSVRGYTDDVLNTSEISELYIVFAVTENRMGEGSTTDAPCVAAVNADAALNRAQSIVDKYAGKSAYDRLAGYKDEICALVKYNEEAAENGSFSADADPWQLLYVFDGNNNTDVVCEGYSKAFQYLCDLDGELECYTVCGVMSGGTGAGRHMWNIVTLGGKNYIVDVTNSDSDTAGSDGSLFLNGTAGSVDEGYTFNTAGGSITFAYDEETVALWSSSNILNLADTAYVPEVDGGNIDIGASDGMTQADLKAALDDAMDVYELDTSVVLTSDFTVPAGITLVLMDDTTLTVESGELNIEGVIVVQSGASLIVESGASYKKTGKLAITAEINRATVKGVANEDMFVTFIASDEEELISTLDTAGAGGYAGAEVRPNASFSVEQNVTVPAGVSMFIRGATLTVSDGYTLTNNGRITLAGNGGLTIEEFATLINNGVFEADDLNNFDLRGELIGNHPNTISQEQFLEELNAAGGTYELTKTVFIDDLNLNGKSITIAEGATMVVRGEVNLNWTTLTVNGTLDLYGSMFVNNDSHLYANGTVRNCGSLHIGFYKESDIDGYAGTMEINGSMIVEGGYVTLRSMQENAGGSMTVNGTLEICPNYDGWGGFVENAGKIEVNSTGTLNVWIDELFDGGIWVGPSAELTVHDGASVTIDFQSISVAADGSPVLDGLDKSLLIGIYEVNSPEALEAAMVASSEYGTVHVELTESVGMTKPLTIPMGVTLIVKENVSLSVHNTVWTIEGGFVNNGVVQITGGAEMNIETTGWLKNNNTFHVGMTTAEPGTLNISGTMDTNSYMCVHEKGVMNLGEGAIFRNHWGDNGKAGFLQCNGIINVTDGNLDSSGKLIVDNTAAKPAQLNTYGNAELGFYSGADIIIGENGILNVEGSRGVIIENAYAGAYVTIAGKATLRNTWGGNITLINKADVVNYGTVNGNVYLSGSAKFDNQGTVNGQVVYPKGNARLQELIDQGEVDEYGDVNVYLHEHITLDADFTIENGVWIYVEEDASIVVPADKKLTFTSDGHIVNHGYMQVDGALTTNSDYALQNIGGNLVAAADADLDVEPGSISHHVTDDGSVIGINPSLMRAHADIRDVEALEEACDEYTNYHFVEIIVDGTVKLDRDITVPEKAMLQLCYVNSIEGPVAGKLIVSDGCTLTNNGSFIVSANCELIVEAGGKLINNKNANISGNGIYVNKGTEVNEGYINLTTPVTDKDSLIEALKEAAENNSGYVCVNESVDIVLEEGEEIVVPSYVSVEFFGNLTLRNGAKLTINERGDLYVYRSLTAEAGSQLINHGAMILLDGSTTVVSGAYIDDDRGNILVTATAAYNGLPEDRMIYQARFTSSEELADLLEYAKSGPYNEYEFNVNVDLNITGTLVIPGNTSVKLHDGCTVMLGAGTDMTNYGRIIIYEGSCLGILPDASLDNQGQVIGYGQQYMFVADGGSFTGNDPVPGENGDNYGIQATTWDELVEALKTPANPNHWATIFVPEKISVPANTTMTIPDYVEVVLFAELAVPSSSNIVIEENGCLFVDWNGETTGKLTVNGKLTNSGLLQVYGGSATVKTYAGNGTVYQGEGTTISGISKSLIEYDIFVGDFATLKSKAKAALTNGYKETYLLAMGDITIPENFSTGSKVSLFVREGTMTVPAGVTLTTNCKFVAQYNGALNIEEGGKVNFNGWSQINGDSRLDNHGTLTLGEKCELGIFGVVDNYGTINVYGSYEEYEDGHLNNHGDGRVVNGAVADIMTALEKNDSYTISKPITISDYSELYFDTHKTINITGDGAIIVEDNGVLALGHNVEIFVSNGGKIEIQDNAGLDIYGNAYVEIQDGSLIAEDKNTFISVDTWEGAMLMICEDVADYIFNENIDKQQMTGLYLIHSEEELLDVLNNKVAKNNMSRSMDSRSEDGYGDHTLVLNSSFSIKGDVEIPANVSVLIRDNNVVTIEQGANVKFDGLMNIIHGGQLNVNGVLDVRVDGDGAHFPSGYINVASSGKINVAKNAEMKLEWATLNLGNAGTLTNMGIVRNSGRIVRNDGSDVVGNLIVEEPKYEGWGLAYSLADLKGLLDQGIGQIEIRGEVVLNDNFAFGDMEFMVADGGRLVIPEGIELTLDNCMLELWHDAEVIVAGTLNLNGRTNMGGTLTVEETGIVNNNGIFSMYGTVNNFGSFVSDRDLMWDSFEDEDGNIWNNWTWNGPKPIVLNDTTMGQDEFEALLNEAAEGGNWNWVTLRKRVELERDLEINQPITMEYPGAIIVPDGVTLTINRVVDFLHGRLEVLPGGTLINNSRLNLYDGDITIHDNATLRTHEINGADEQLIEVHGGWLNIAPGANDVEINHNDGSDYEGIITYYPINQGDYNLNGVDPKYVQVHKSIGCLGDLEDLFWYNEKGWVNSDFGMDAHTWGTIYVDHDLELPRNLNLNLGELIIASGNTLTNKGDIWIHEYGKIQIEAGATLDNEEGSILVEGGQIINEGGTFFEGNLRYSTTTGRPATFNAEQLESNLREKGEAEIVGFVKLDRNIYIEPGQRLDIGTGATLIVPEGFELHNSGITVIRGGKMIVDGVVKNYNQFYVDDRAELTIEELGEFKNEEDGHLLRVNNGTINGIGNDQIIDMRDAFNAEDLHAMTNNYDGYEGVEVWTYGDITLNENYYVSSDVYVNVSEGTLRVASGNTMTVCGRMQVSEGTRLVLEDGAKLEVLGELVVFGEFINEGQNNIIQGENSYMSREAHVYDGYQLSEALKRADNLDRIFVYGDNGAPIEVPADLGKLEIPEHLHIIVHGALNVPAEVDLVVNGSLFVDGGIMNVYSGNVANNGAIHVFMGGDDREAELNIYTAAENVSSDGLWYMGRGGEISGSVDHLITYETTAYDPTELMNIMQEISDRNFKLAFVTVSGYEVQDSYFEVDTLTVPNNTILTLRDELTFVVKDDHTLTNNGVIDIINNCDLIISEHAQYINDSIDDPDDGRIEIQWGEGRFLPMNGQKISKVFVVDYYEDGTYDMYPVDSISVYNEKELRAAINAGYYYIYAHGDIELTDSLTLAHAGDAEHPQAQNLILDEGSRLVVNQYNDQAEEITLTINGRLNILGGSELKVYGNLVNNVYGADNFGIWIEDGSLFVEGGTYTAHTDEDGNVDGFIHMISNSITSARVEGIGSKNVIREMFVYSEAEFYEVMAAAAQYQHNRIFVRDNLILTRSVVIPENTHISIQEHSLTVPTGITVINNGILELEASGADNGTGAQIVVKNGAYFYNENTLIIGCDEHYASLIVDAGGFFHNRGIMDIPCVQLGCEKGHFVNNTVLVRTLTASVNGNTENVTVGLNTPVQLTAAVQPANAAQKEVEWTIVETGEVLENGILTVNELPAGIKEMDITVRATATDGSGVFDELTITVKEYKVSVTVTGNTTLKFNEKTTMTASCQAEGKKAVWSLEPGDELFATLSVNKTTNVATLTAKTLTEEKTVTVVASAADGTETPFKQEIIILPKVQKVSVSVNGTDYTGQTMTYDLGATDARILLVEPTIAPVDAFEDIKWTVDKTALAKFMTNDDGTYQMTDGAYMLQLLTENTGTVKITATAQDGSKLTGVATIKIVDLIQEIALKDKTDELVGGKTFTFTAYEAENGETIGKKLDKTKVQWSLDAKDAPFASIDANGKLTTQKVLEKVTVTVTAKVIGNELAETVSWPVTIYPLTTQVEININKDQTGMSRDYVMVNDMTVKFDPAKGEIYLPGEAGQQTVIRTSGGSLTLDEVLFPNDLMINGEPWMDAKWTSSSTAIAKIDAAAGVLTVQKATNGTYKTGTVTITAAAQDGSGKKATVKIQIGTFAEAVDITNPDADGILRVGEYTTLKAVTTPEELTTTGVTWSLKNADDSAYVTLATNGKVTAKTVYEKHIVPVVATSKDGMASNEINIIVMPKAEYVLNLTEMQYNDFGEEIFNVVTGQTLLADLLSGSNTVNLYAKMFNMTDDEIADWDVTWTSSSTSIAMFEVWDDEAGDFVNAKTVTGSDATVKMLKSGSATITITAKDPADTTGKKNLTAKVTIKATNLVEALEIESKTETFTVASGKALTLTATAFPTEASTKTVTWSLAPGGEEFATITTSGKVTAKANLTQAATVTVIATAKDGSGVTAEQEIVILPLVQGVDIWMKDLGVLTNTTLVWDMVENPYLSVSADTYPEIASQDVTWSSSSKAIAEIDPATGVITCKKAGTVTITATAKDGSGKKATFKLTVVKQMTSLKLADQIIAGGKTLDLSKLVEILEKDTTNKKLTWTMTGDGSKEDGTAFATLSTAGKLTTKTVTGTKKVTITVASTDGSELVAQCEVTIMPSVTKVSIYEGETLVTGKTLTMGVGEQLALDVVNDPVGSLQDVTWSSNNAAVTVDETGMVAAVTAGKTVTITAKANDGSGKSATVKIKTIQKMEELILPATDIVASTKNITLKPEILPSNTTTKTVTWSIVTGSEYATIDKNGKLTAKKLADDEAVTVTVMAASTDGSELAAITRVTITPLTNKVRILNVEGTEMVKTEKLYLDEGMMYLTGVSDPVTAAQTYNWTVSNSSYAGFAAEDGETVQAKASGQAVALVGLVPGKTVTVTATADDGSGKKASFKVTTVQRMQELTLDEMMVMGVGKNLNLRANIEPANTSNKTLSWQIEDMTGLDESKVKLSNGVLKVEKNALINDEDCGKIVIGATSTDGSELYASCEVTVHQLTDYVEIRENDKKITETIILRAGEDRWVDGVAISKTDGDAWYLADNFTWTTSGASYVSFVNEYGEEVSSISGGDATIKALKPGKTITITATAKDGSGKKATFKVQTVQMVDTITLPESQVLTPGKNVTLKAQIEPANATNKNLRWEIFDVDENGCPIDWEAAGSAYASVDKGVVKADRIVDGTKVVAVRAISKDENEMESNWCYVTISQRTTKISLWEGSEPVIGKTLNLFTDQERRITATSDPADSYTQYSWTVSNAAHASFVVETEGEETLEGKTVGGDVRLVALEPGKTVTITATAMDGSGKKATFKVKTMQHVTDIQVENRFVGAGRSIVLSSTVSPNDASNTKVDYEIQRVVAVNSGYEVDSADVVVKLGNILFAKRTDEFYKVEMAAVAQDGSGVTSNFFVNILPEVAKGVNIFNGATGTIVKDVEMMVGERIDLYGEPENYGMAVQSFDWSTSDEETVCLIEEVSTEDEFGTPSSKEDKVAQMENYAGITLEAQKPGVAVVTLKTVDGSNKTAKVVIHVAETQD